jgi:hypothetical protein
LPELPRLPKSPKLVFHFEGFTVALFFNFGNPAIVAINVGFSSFE